MPRIGIRTPHLHESGVNEGLLKISHDIRADDISRCLKLINRPPSIVSSGPITKGVLEQSDNVAS